MKINSTYQNVYTKYKTNNNNYKTNNQSPAFGNLFFQQVALKPSMTKIRSLSRKLDMETKDVFRLVNNRSSEDIKFLNRLSQLFREQNNFSKAVKKKNQTLIKEIFEIVENPQKGHYVFLDIFNNSSLEEIKNILANAKSTKKLNYAIAFKTDILEEQYGASKNILTEILSSPNANEYVSNYEKYRPYFMLNAKNENAIKELDKSLANKTFKADVYKKQYEQEVRKNAYKKIFTDTKGSNQLAFAEIKGEESKVLLQAFKKYGNISQISLDAGTDRIILDILKTTTKDNLNIRRNVIKYFKRDSADTNETIRKYYEMLKLFETMDKSKPAKSFIQKAIDCSMQFNSVEDVNKLLQSFPHKKLELFFDNVVYIFENVEYSKRIKVLAEHIEEPFLKTFLKNIDNTKKKSPNGFTDSSLEKLEMYFMNKMAKIKYKVWQMGSKDRRNIPEFIDLESKAEYLEKLKAEVLKPQESKLEQELREMAQRPKSEASAPIIENSKILIETPIATEKVDGLIPQESKLEKELREMVQRPKTEEPASVIENDKTNIVKTAKAAKKAEKTAASQKNIKATKTTTKTPAKPESEYMRSKLMIKENVEKYISKKLGKKTFDSQKTDYNKYATKMRFEMLPEIFLSITENNKISKLTNKKAKKCTNNDAVELFKQINGNNKKLVNYLLKKRNANNERMFSVREIINILENARLEIVQNRKTNKNYKAKQVKEFYNNIFDNNVEQFGKLKIIRKTKARA